MVRCLNCMELYDEQFEVCSHCGFVRGTPPKEAYHLHPGTLLADRYTIGTVLGFGGFGITYRAWDRVLEQMVAVKEYYPNGIVNRIPGQDEVIIYTGERANEFQKGKERFLSEARNMARFSTHPNIVNVFAFFEANNTAYIVMEFLDGISYKQYIRNNGGKVTPDIAIEVTLSVLDALHEIHKARIIHRDISPDNIFICEGGIIKVIDFGAARFSTGDEEKTMSIILKPGYAPPEQYRNKSRQGPWTDIYAVGAVLYRSITGVMPEESVNRMVEDNMKKPKELDSEIPEYLDNSIMRAMALNQELRFQNVEEFRDALQNKKKVLDVGSELKKRKGRRAAGIACIFVLILAAGLVCYRMYETNLRRAYLKEAQIEVWIPVKGTGEAGENVKDRLEEAQAVFQEALSNFCSDNNMIKVEVRAFPEEEYRDKLIEAMESGVMPDLFDSTLLGREYEDSYAPLDEVYDLLKENGEADKYYFLEKLNSEDHQMKQFPLSFQVPVIYANTNLYKNEGAIESEADIRSDKKISAACNPQDLIVYEEYFGISLDTLGEYEDFRNKNSALYLGDTGDYQSVQKDMAGIYRVYFPEKDRVKGHYTDLFSVWDNSSDARKAAAIRAVYYLLSEGAQNIYHVRNVHGLPLNKESFERYLSINVELQELRSYIDGIELKSVIEIPKPEKQVETSRERKKYETLSELHGGIWG